MQNIKKFLICTAVVVMMNMALCADFFESICYRIDCFDKKQPGCNRDLIDAYPQYSMSYLNLTKADTYFYMFTKASPDEPELIHKCEGKLPNQTTFNPMCHTEVMIPGYVSGICNFGIYRELKNERLKSGCYNVLLLDYMWGNIPDLAGAKKNLYIVAAQLATVIKNIKDRFSLSKHNFTLTGHSYGAHVAGLVGQIEPIGKILGIDPAGGPFTATTPPSERLDAGDADCVVVIHCNAGDCLPEYFGINITCGTVDFWINDGKTQLSCYDQMYKAFLKQDFVYAFYSMLPPACFHFQCLQYYRASMNPTNCSFIGYQSLSNIPLGSDKCGPNGRNCLAMGINTCDCLADEQKNKTYYLKTKYKCPYCDNSALGITSYSCAAANITNGVPKK